MSEIKLEGTHESGDPSIQETAFSIPGAKIRFDFTRKHQVYSPYLIRFVSQSGDTLRFRGVDLKDSSVEFDSNGTGQGNYTVDLGRMAHVYRELPSSLAELGEAQSYAVLFLSDQFLDEKDPSQHLLRARGGPKWPSGAFAELLAKHEAMKAELERLRNAVGALLKDATLVPGQKAKFEQLFGEFVE